MVHASLSDQFRADHAPGKDGLAPLSASRWPVILDLPAEYKTGWPAYLPSKLSYALHLTGLVPFDDTESPELSRGKLMEPVGETLLRERGWKIFKTQFRAMHPSMNALTYLDVVGSPESGPGALSAGDGAEIVEFKVVDDRDYKVDWADGPPLYPVLQVHAQMAISGILHANVGAIVMGYKGVDLILHPVERDEKIIEALEYQGQRFLELIAQTPTDRLAEVLVEEDHPDSYRAWSRAISLTKGASARMDDPEAVTRALRLHQARLDKSAAEAVCEAEQNWFAVHAPQAETIELLDGTRIERKVVKTPAKPVPARVRPASQHVRWTVKPAGKDDPTDD